MTPTMTTQETDMPMPRQLPDNADPAVDYKTVADRPGILRGEACLIIQTRQAQRLVYGRQQTREHPGIVGLVRFAMLMKRLWVSAMLDDPYADWFLLQIHEALEAGREELKRIRAEMLQLLGSAPTVEITVAHSLKPVRVPLQFANPYGYMGAYLVGDYDELVRAVLTARHVGMLARDPAEQLLTRGGRQIRRAFLLPTLWRHCAVDRDDVHQNTVRAQTAAASMGILPQEIVDGRLRAQHAPEIRKMRLAEVSQQRGLLSTPATIEQQELTAES